VEEGPRGVRAMALNEDGTFTDDFVFESPSPNVLHVRNAPSPAATSAMAIAREISQRAASQFFVLHGRAEN